jgi:hypothetical protein
MIGPGERLDVRRVAELHRGPAGGAAILPGVQLGNGVLPGVELGNGVLPGVELGSGVLPGARAVGAGLVRRATPLAAGDQVG